MVKAKLVLEQNFGVEFSNEKWLLLAEMIDEEGWTEERFWRTFKWFLKNKKFPAWTIADWFEFGIKIYPYSWYLSQVNEFGGRVNEEIERYKLPNDVIGYRYADGEDLPFEKLPPITRKKIG